MSIVAARLASLTSPLADSQLATRAKEILAELTIPKTITRPVIEHYLRKAFRTGAWRALAPETRALLLVSSRILNAVKSPILASLLRRVFTEIELFTFRGRALFTGIILAFRNFTSRALEILRDVAKILFLGVSYLNSPTMYRVHG